MSFYLRFQPVWANICDFFFLYPKCVYWDGSPLILIQVILAMCPSEGASFCKPCFSSYRLTEDSGAANTQDYHLCTAKDGGGFTASWHFTGFRALHKVLLLVFPPLLFWRWMKEILCKRHVEVESSSPSEKLYSITDRLSCLLFYCS